MYDADQRRWLTMTGFAGSRRACRTGCSRNQKGVLTDDEHGRHETNDGCRQRSR